MTLITSVVEALSEGATLAVVFMAVEEPVQRKAPVNGVPIRCRTYGQQRRAGSITCLATALFISLLALAVLLQDLSPLLSQRS